jgi:LmbE family N-acetylglucosaminyl deacetylase
MTDVGRVLGSLKVTVLSPHSDDAALSLGGTLALAARQGLDCRLVTLFSRSRRTRSGGIELDETSVTAMRKEEDRAFTSLLGDAECFWCDLPDPSVRLPDSREHWYEPRPFSDRECGYVDDVTEFTRRHSDGRLILAPAGLGANRDHLIVRAAALRLAHAGHRVILYEDLPYASRIRRRVLVEVLAEFAAGEGMTAEARAVSHALLCVRKRRALLAYRSQVNRDIVDRVLLYSLRVGRFVTSAERVWNLTARLTPAGHTPRPPRPSSAAS